ncbi:MAG: hypothetical protein HQM09_07585 [Candidatus Riflebacteria bacterium]|nr:hypothetical protein [Candidatus Riflebacteria bacterium]
MKWLLESMMDAFVAIFTWLVHVLSFSNDIEAMADALNHKIEEPPSKLNVRHFSHPGGFVRELGKRRLSIAASYIKIARDLSPDDVDDRLAALRMLVEQSLHAKTLTMPLNTARVQVQLMKEAVKAQNDKRRQMEALADFGLASFGQEAVIRRFLNRLQMIEVPEEEKPLRELGMGWDDHVHDTLSEGRKTPTQVLLDAFIKGISELTIVYSHLEQRRMIHEAMTAGHLLGIKVNIGVEFSIGESGFRRHFMYVPGNFEDSASFFAFFDNRQQIFALFREGLLTNAVNRRKTMENALARFNTTQRAKLNTGYEPDSPCWMQSLTIGELDRIVATGQPSRVHVGELLFQKFREIFHRRVLHLKAQLLAAKDRFRRGIYSEWELKNITTQYDNVREFFETMTPDSLRAQYMDSRDVVDYDSVFQDEESLMKLLIGEGGKIIFIHPLEMGLREAMLYIMRYAHLITHIESFNLRDSMIRNANDLIIFNKFVYNFNNSTTEELLSFLEQQGLTGLKSEEVRKAQDSVRGRGLIPICGSDSTGRDPTIPGMGFIRINRIPQSIASSFCKTHFTIPRPIADLITHKGIKHPGGDSGHENSEIICMGKIVKPVRNTIGDEEHVELIGLERFMTYLNPFLKNILRILVGFSAAFFGMQLGFGAAPEFQFQCVEFAAIWLTITFIRNVMVDLIAASGINYRAWTHHNINFDNISQSLFWTGFSVPILNTVKSKFDLFWGGPTSGFIFESAKFFFLCLANGLYITTHNRLRNFDRRVIQANFFRSILAWPFAVIFSPIGNFMQVPSPVQTKFWSDVIGGLIEGSGKYRQRFRIRLRDLTELLPRLDSADRDIRLTAMLDILYIWARQPRGSTCLRKLLLQQQSLWDRWRHRISPGEREKAVKRYMHFYDRLVELFGDPGCLTVLCDFVLKNYQDRESVILTEVIGQHCEPFLSWQRSLRKQLHPEK